MQRALLKTSAADPWKPGINLGRRPFAAMWDQPNLVWLLSIVAGALVVAIALVGFLSWRLSQSFVEGDGHFTLSVCLPPRKRKSDAATGQLPQTAASSAGSMWSLIRRPCPNRTGATRAPACATKPFAI